MSTERYIPESAVRDLIDAHRDGLSSVVTMVPATALENLLALARPAAAEGVESREKNLGWIQINVDGVPVEADSGEPIAPEDLWLWEALPQEPGRWNITALFTPFTPDDGEGQEGKRHRWSRDGERCLDCGDKDWMAGPVCSAPSPDDGEGQADG